MFFFYGESDNTTVSNVDPYFYNTSLLLKMDSDFSDSSVHQHTVTTSGNVSISNSEFKYDGGSGYFDGNTNTGVSFSSSDSFDLRGVDWTMEAWIYPDGNYSDYRKIIAKRLYTGDSTDYQLYLSINTGELRFYEHGGANTSINTGVTPTTNQWTHVAAVRKDGVITIYVNGEAKVSETRNISAYRSGSPLGIGNLGGLNRNPFSGYIDDVRITKGVARYTANFTPPDSHPTTGPSEIVSTDLQLHLDAGDTNSYSGTGTTWYDLSSNSNDATAVNGIEGTWNSDGYFDFEQTISPDPYFTLGLPTSLQFQAHTIEVWVNPENISTTNHHSTAIHPILSSQYDNGTAGISINVDGRTTHGGGPNGIHYQVGLGSNWTTDGSYGITSANSVSEGVWQHFVVSWQSGGAKKFYKNGEFFQTMGTWSGTVNWSGTSWFIGIQGDANSGRQFDGKIAIIRAYNRELTSGEILQNFNATKDRFGL